MFRPLVSLSSMGRGFWTTDREPGDGLSGGEKQRLSIARTLLYDPKILVLDEATGSIDAEAERAIQQALEVLVKGRTTIAIAHRLSTLRNADRIIVFDRGRLVEQGKHAQLMEQDGVYARLVRIQTQISKDASIDKLVIVQSDQEQAALQSKPISESACGDESATTALPATTDTSVNDRYLINWLLPDECQFSLGQSGELVVTLSGVAAERIESQEQADTEPSRSAFVVCTFPATHPERYLSIRSWNTHGDEIEIGLLSDLTQLPPATQTLIRRFISRRYLFRRISRIHSLELAHGFLEFDVETNNGRRQFTMRWSESQAQDFGRSGKLLIDTEDNRYVVADVDKLPEAERIKFRQHIYW